MGSKVIKDAIDNLGKFFGVRAADAYLNAILADDSEGFKTPWPLLPATNQVASPRGTLLNTISGGGDTSVATTEALLEFCKQQGPSKEKPNDKGTTELKLFASDVCITPHNDKLIVSEGPMNSFPGAQTVDGMCEDQGLGAPSDGKNYTVDDLRMTKADDDNTKINVIQVFPAAGNVANSDCDVVTLFLNAIPTMEMARAVPYMDIMTITVAGDDPSKTRDMSLGRWMLGETMSNPSDQLLFNSESPDVDIDENSEKKQFRTAASMEIFTSPATMPSLTSMNNDLSDPFRPFLSMMSLKLNVAGAGGMFSYKSGDLELKLHDKTKLGSIAPMVSPDSIGRVRFIITYGWSHPDGESNNVSHPPNRFGELIDAMKVTETYQVINTDSTFEENGEVSINLKLSLLGATGMDNIDITLSQVVDLVEEMEKNFDGIRKALKQYQNRAGSSGKVAVPTFLKAGSNMSSARNMKTADVKKLLAWTSKRKSADPVVDDIDKFCRKIFGKDGKGGLNKSLNSTKDSQLGEMIAHLKKTPDPFLRPVGTYKGSIGRKKFPDSRKLKFEPGKRTAQDTVSLGKLLTFFVGESMGASQQFSEIQLVFHAFNESASYLQDYNIAQFPISISDLESVLKKKFNKLGHMNLNAFLDLINVFFIKDPAAYGYGFDKDNIYGARKKDITQRKLQGKANKKKFVMENYRREILKTAYGAKDDSAGGITFKQPQIMSRLEALPARSKVYEGPDAKPDPSKTILKIQIFDQNCNTVETLYSLFEGFAGAGIMSKISRPLPPGSPTPARGARHQQVINNQMNILEKDKDAIESAKGLIDPDKIDSAEGVTQEDLMKFVEDKYVIKPAALTKIKEVIMDLTPTLTWGGGSAGLASAKLSTQNDSGLSTVNILRQSNDDGDKGQDGIPMRIMPTELQIETMGCPYLSFGQQFFVDFGTNSTADNFYAVVGLDHDIGDGQFKTSVKMIQIDAFGRYQSPFDSIAELAVAAHIAKRK